MSWGKGGGGMSVYYRVYQERNDARTVAQSCVDKGV